jgi:hypothetical protein
MPLDRLPLLNFTHRQEDGTMFWGVYMCHGTKVTYVALMYLRFAILLLHLRANCVSLKRTTSQSICLFR